MGKRIPDLADGLAFDPADEIEISRAGATSLRLALTAVRAGLFPTSGGTITGNVVVTGDVTVNTGILRANQGFQVVGDAEFNGEIHFLSTTAPGLILNNLTTVQRDALFVFGGELIHNTDTSTMDYFDGSTWSAVATAGNFVSKAGDTMTGLLGFSGTTHAGLRLNILTTTQRNALTPGAADFLYDSTLSRPFYWNGFSWDSMVRTTGDSMTGDLAILSLSRGGSLVFSPAIADGSTPYAFSTDITHTSGNLFIVFNNGTPLLSVDFAGGIVGASGATFSGNVQSVSFSHATALTISPTIADASTPYLFNTTLAHTSGNLFDLKNSGTSKFSVDFAGGITGISASITNGVSAGNFSSTGDEMTLDASAADGIVAFKFDTNVSHTSGNLLSIGNNSSVKASVNYLGVGDFSNLTVAQSTLAYGATTTVDLSGDGFKTVTLAGNVTFATSNRAAKRSVTLHIVCDGSARTFTFPSWIWVGDIPTGIAASKNAILTLTATGAAETDVIAAYAVQG